MSQSPEFTSEEQRRAERASQRFRAVNPPGVFWHDGEWYVRASSVSSGQQKLVLKDNDAFLVANALGDFPSAIEGDFGYYHRGTRYLSTLEVRLRGELPLLLDWHGEGSQLVVELTNGASWELGDRRLPSNALLLQREIVIERDVLYQSLRLHNFDLGPIDVDLMLIYGADFADTFEVRGTKRAARGMLLEPECEASGVRLAYRGLDGRVRVSDIRFETPALEVCASWASFRIALGPRMHRELRFRVQPELFPEREPRPRPLGFSFPTERNNGVRLHGVPAVLTSHEGLNRIFKRAIQDVVTMLSNTPEGLYPYAGIPWYCAPFGRDGSITALELLPWMPEVARGVLLYQARHQGKDFDDFTDREPGKIFHEYREGEMAALREIPFVPYYGSADATPLFAILLSEYVATTHDLALLERLWPNLIAALHWIERHGDLDGDGFVEYLSRSPVGLRNQGWKDSFDGISHEDGSLAKPPVAPCEIQGYVERAWSGAAGLAELRGEHELARTWRERATTLRARIHQAYWLDDLGTYALALDADKRPCRVVTTNAGHLLWSGTAEPALGARLARRLCEPDLFTGYGLRTLSAQATRYNPLSYHNGSVWPHDNALVADGLRRYGNVEGLFTVFTGIVNALETTSDGRAPELFCGFQRESWGKLTPYPVACAPQAWSSAAMLQFLRTLLGLSVHARSRTVWLDDPLLPAWLEWVEVRNLQTPSGPLDFLTVRGRRSCSVEILSKPEDVRLYVKK